MPRTLRSLLAGMTLTLAAAACGGGGTGTVIGDAYLVEDMGAQASLAGLRVYLLEAEKPARAEMDTALARLCPPGGDRAAEARAWAERGRILSALALRATVTDARAAFVFDSVPPGRYRLWADTTVGEGRWSWLAEVRVQPGDTLRANLSNGNPDENPFRCRF